MLNPRIKRLKIETDIPVRIYVDEGKERKAQEFFNKMPQYITEAYDKACSRFAKQILSQVRKAISTGIPPKDGKTSWKPLAPRTVEAYKRWGYDEFSLYSLLGQMYREVNVFKGNRGRYYVGFPRGVTSINPNSKSKSTRPRPTLARLVDMLERGGDYHPPRPLFNPAYVAAGGKDRLDKFLLEDLRSMFNKHRIY